MAKAQEPPLAEKLQKDVDFWRDSYDKAQKEAREASFNLMGRSAELVDATHRAEKAEAALEPLVKQNLELRTRLITLLDHTAGKNGKLEASELFCAVCENPLRCPARSTREYLKSLELPQSETREPEEATA